MLAEIVARETELMATIGDGTAYFMCLTNAAVVAAAEEYYRKSWMGGSTTWNLRDQAMTDTVVRALSHAEQTGVSDGRPVRAVVWAHNSHLGDVSAVRVLAISTFAAAARTNESCICALSVLFFLSSSYSIYVAPRLSCTKSTWACSCASASA